MQYFDTVQKPLGATLNDLNVSQAKKSHVLSAFVAKKKFTILSIEMNFKTLCKKCHCCNSTLKIAD